MKIVLEDNDPDEPVRLPDCADLLNLCDAIEEICVVLRAEANRNPTKWNWEATIHMESSVYDIHGAASALAKQEGLLK